MTARYFIGLSLFKLAIGALLLLVGWDAVVGRGGGVLLLAANMTLAFVPAAFAKPLFQRIALGSELRGLGCSLLFAGLLLPFEPLLLSQTKVGFALLHMAVWTLIFTAEAGYETLFVRLGRESPLARLQRLSALSMSTIQVSTISGPLVVPLVRIAGPDVPYYVCAASFMASGLVILLNREGVRVAEAHPTISRRVSGDMSSLAWSHVLALSMIWPAVAACHMFFPLASMSATDPKRSILVAAGAEFVFGSAIAFAGVQLARKPLAQSKTQAWRFGRFDMVLFTVGLLVLAASGYSVWCLGLGTFISAWYFGLARITARSEIARSYSPEKAGALISSANAWSGGLVVVFLVLFYVERTLLGVSSGIYLTPVVALAAAGALLLTQFKEGAA